MIQLENVPEYLRKYGRFCLWKYETVKGRKTKVPYNPNDTQSRAASNNPETFTDWPGICEAWRRERDNFSGIGVGVFSDISAFDIDHCITDGQYSQTALYIIDTLKCYTEISPSGEGIRIFFRRAPGLQYDREKYYINNRSAGLEIYISGMTNKFLTITGNVIKRDPVAVRNDEVVDIVHKFMKRPEKTAPAAPDREALQLSDSEILQKAEAATNGYKFMQLYSGNWEGAGYGSQSEADQALCDLLAFWSGRDPDQMDRLFRSSGLMRPKWERKDYRTATISKAIRDCGKIYTGAERASAAEDFAEDPKPEENILELLTCLEDVEEKPVNWLIDNWVPKNSTTLIGADGGSGKTSVWCDLLAKLSAGRTTLLDDGYSNRPPMNVMFFSSEDSADTVLKKKLRLAGANMKNIQTMDIAHKRFNEIKFENGGLLEKLIKAYKPALCVFDPVQQFIPDNVKMAERNAMRRCLAPLKRLCDLYDTTFILLCHTNKRDNASGRKRLADSADLWDFARSVIMLGETGQGEIRYLSHEKNSYGKQNETILYLITDNGIEYQGTSYKRDIDYVYERAQRKEGPSPQRIDAEDCIREYLELNGETEISALKENILAAGISATSFNNAKKGMLDSGQIIRKQVSQGRGKGVKWFLNLSTMEEFSEEFPDDFL